MRVVEVNIHPVKSTSALSVGHAAVEPWGLAHDRRFMVVDSDGVVVTAREHHDLLGVTAMPLGLGRIRLDGRHAGPIDVDATASDEQVLVRVHKSELQARRVDAAAAASLRQLNDWIAEAAVERGEQLPKPLTMRRFRPNVVVDGSAPFAEDHWRRVTIDDVEFRVAKPCDRCVMTTVDPVTLASGKEPLRTLARYRRWDGKTWFGAYLIPDGSGHISVGGALTATG